MPNHVHLIAVPGKDDSMALALRQTHGRYASYLNGRQGSSGHLWQGRFYSCPLGASHLWSALRYTEMNPVRAGMILDPVSYAWSSAARHCGYPTRLLPLTLAPELWRDCWNPESWREFLRASPAAEENQALRVNTHTGRPLGAREFVETLERRLARPLVRQKGGRPRAGAGSATILEHI
jgi:putative transposase